jgi:hypothetical protein
MRTVVNDSLFGEDVLQLQQILDGMVSKRNLVDIKYDDEELKSIVGEENALIVKKSIKDKVNGFIARTVAFSVNDLLFDENTVAYADNITYNNIVENVQERIMESLTDFVSILVNDEILKITETENEDG